MAKALYSERKLQHITGNQIFPRVRGIYFNEMHPILEALDGNSLSPELKLSLKNYLIILLVSTTEQYLSNHVARMIDKHKDTLNISKVVDNDISIPISKLDQLANKKVTAGKLIASSINFANPVLVNSFCSKLFSWDDSFQKIREYSQADPPGDYYFLDTISLNKNWNKFIAMFEMRNTIVHGLKQAKLSTHELRTLCNNTMVFLESASVIYNPDLRDRAHRMIGTWLQQGKKR